MIRINKNIAISDNGFIFNPLTGESFTVNPIGIELIKQLKDGKTYKEIFAVTLEKYAIDDITFEKDFADFTYFLKQYKLATIDEQTNL